MSRGLGWVRFDLFIFKKMYFMCTVYAVLVTLRNLRSVSGDLLFSFFEYEQYLRA